MTQESSISWVPCTTCAWQSQQEPPIWLCLFYCLCRWECLSILCASGASWVFKFISGSWVLWPFLLPPQENFKVGSQGWEKYTLACSPNTLATANTFVRSSIREWSWWTLMVSNHWGRVFILVFMPYILLWLPLWDSDRSDFGWKVLFWYHIVLY